MLILLAIFFSITFPSVVYAWPCEGPCNDSYTKVYATSPASGGTYGIGSTVRFTTNVERTQMSTYLPFTTQVSTSGGSGWSTSIVSPASYCIYGPYAEFSCGTPRAPDVDIVIDVTVGTGTTTVTVRLDNDLGSFYISPEFTFEITGTDTVQISGLSAQSDTFTGSGNANDNDDVCIYRSGGGTYDVLIEGATSGGEFVLDSGSTTVPMTVYWNDQTGTTGRATINSADTPSLADATGANTSSTSCSGGNSANISWSVSESDLQTLPAGTYTTTLSITISPP